MKSYTPTGTKNYTQEGMKNYTLHIVKQVVKQLERARPALWVGGGRFRRKIKTVAFPDDPERI